MEEEAREKPVQECLICGGPEMDEAMQQSEFTPQVFRCFLKLLNLTKDDYQDRLPDITVCLDCGVKLRQIYVLHNQLIDIQIQLNDYRVQMENDLVNTVIRTATTATTNAMDNNYYVRRRIYNEIQISRSLPESASSLMKGLGLTACDENTDAEDLHTQSPDSTQFEFDSNISTLCDPFLEEEDEVKIKIEQDADDSLHTNDDSSCALQPFRSTERTETTRTVTKNAVLASNRSETPVPLSPKNTRKYKSGLSPDERQKDTKRSKKNKTGDEMSNTELQTPDFMLKQLASSVPKRRPQRKSVSVSTLEELGSTGQQSEGSHISVTNEAIFLEGAKTKSPKKSKPFPASFMCTVPGCRKKFSTQLLRRCHVRKHMTAKSKEKVKVALKEKRKPKLKVSDDQSESGYMCEECGRTLKTRSAFSNHQRNHRGYRFVCKHCGKGFNDRSDIEAHESIHTGELAYKCKYCDLAFRRQKLLRNHQLQKHEEFFVNGKSIFECEVCKAVLSNGTVFRQHMMKHTGEFPYRCHICGNGQVSKTNHDHHMKTHAEERNFICSVCQKSFKFNAALVIHMRSHTGERPFQCKSCPKNYMDHSALRKHVRAVHNNGEASFVCHLCGKENPSSHYLTVHLRSHRLKEERAAKTADKKQPKGKQNTSEEYRMSSDSDQSND